MKNKTKHVEIERDELFALLLAWSNSVGKDASWRQLDLRQKTEEVLERMGLIEFGDG